MDLVVLIVLQFIGAILFGAIFRKAGYSGWMGLLMVVPVVNLVTLVWFACTTWPLEMGYSGREKTAVDEAWEYKMLMRKGMALEKRGKYDDAVACFEQVAQRAEGLPIAELAHEQIRSLQDRDSA